MEPEPKNGMIGIDSSRITYVASLQGTDLTVTRDSRISAIKDLASELELALRPHEGNEKEFMEVRVMLDGTKLIDAYVAEITPSDITEIGFEFWFLPVEETLVKTELEDMYWEGLLTKKTAHPNDPENQIVVYRNGSSDYLYQYYTMDPEL